MLEQYLISLLAVYAVGFVFSCIVIFVWFRADKNIKDPVKHIVLATLILSLMWVLFLPIVLVDMMNNDLSI